MYGTHQLNQFFGVCAQDIRRCPFSSLRACRGHCKQEILYCLWKYSICPSCSNIFFYCNYKCLLFSKELFLVHMDAYSPREERRGYPFGCKSCVNSILLISSSLKKINHFTALNELRKVCHAITKIMTALLEY